MSKRSVEQSSDNILAQMESYVELLERKLKAARAAINLFRDEESLGQEVAETSRVVSPAGSSCQGIAPQRGSGDRLPSESSAGSKSMENGGESAATGANSEYEKTKEALRTATSLGKRIPVIELLRVIARANGGRVKLNVANTVLRELKVTKSSGKNLPGYMIKKMQLSGEFEREEGLGRGIYRWLNYVDPVPDVNSSEIVGGEVYSAPPVPSGDVDERYG